MAAATGNKRQILTNIRGMLKKKGIYDGENGTTSTSEFDGWEPPGVAKSASSSSISSVRLSIGSVAGAADSRGSNSALDTQQMDQDMVLALTQDVRVFSEALSKLHSTLQKPEESDEMVRVLTHEKLGEVLCILKAILKRYPAVNSTDLLTATGILISRVKGFDYRLEDGSTIYEAIDQLALAFSSSVSEYLMGDIESAMALNHGSIQSLDSSVSVGADLRQLDVSRELQAGAKMDAHLLQMESGVERALDRAKAWSKYAKDVITYIQKRTTLEMEFSRGLTKLAITTRQSIIESGFLPFQSIYCTALDQDKELATTSLAACTLVQTGKFVEPLTNQRTEHEKIRRQLRDDWNREVKRMSDAITNLKKAKLTYYQRCLEYDKAKDSVLRIESDALGNSAGLSMLKQNEKKKKMCDEVFQKSCEAETSYKSCVHEANVRQMELEKTKGEILTRIRELITLSERTMKAATIAYFQLQHTVSAPAPVQYQTLCENCRSYEPGAKYSEYVTRLPMDDIVHHETYVFEPYALEEVHKSRSSTGAHVESPSSAKQSRNNGSESESLSSGNKSADNSPTASPRASKKLHSTTVEIDLSKSQENKRTSKTSHIFRKLRTPSKCRVCETYLYFNGLECEQCGVACHKKCNSNLQVQCGNQTAAVERRMTTFGVSFDDYIMSMNVEVPIIVSQCIRELDSRGLDAKGIYRVSGVKSKVEKLCQSFEIGGDVDLSEHQPHVISNVLKLYLRQLPEPLLTVKLYPEFVEVAKDQASGKSSPQEVVNRLKRIVEKLPPANLKTATTIIHHLKRVCSYEEENKMSPPNLGIVFGPTLLRPNEGPASLDSLMDTAHQARAVELLITHSEELFGLDQTGLDQTRQSFQAGALTSLTEDECDSSDASESEESERLHSIDSNLAEDIMAEIRNKHPHRDQFIGNGNEHLDQPHKLAGHRRPPYYHTSDGVSGRSDSDSEQEIDSALQQEASGTKPSVYHQQVMRSASMPNATGVLPEGGVPAGPVDVFDQTTERVRPLTAKQSAPDVLNSSSDLSSEPRKQSFSIRTNSLVRPPPAGGSTPATGLFYVPASRPGQGDRTMPTVELTFSLPDIGAPDITSELINSGRDVTDSDSFAMSMTDGSSDRQRKSNNNSIETLCPKSNKPVFYTNSMKKRSTEPKFV